MLLAKRIYFRADLIADPTCFFQPFLARPVNLEGSSNGQCNRVVTPAKIGQPSASTSLHTVTTNWNICPDVQTSKTRCVVFFEISIPSSRSASTTSGLIVPGSNPAL